MLLFLALNILFVSCLSAEDNLSAHFALGDYRSCEVLAKREVKSSPQNKEAWVMYISSLAHLGKENEAYENYRKFCDYHKDSALDHTLLETLSWGVLNHYSHSSYPKLRYFSLVGAAMCNDAKSVLMTKRLLDDPVDAIREVAVKATAQLRDDVLQEKITQLLAIETSPQVRYICIEALGVLEMRESIPILLDIVDKEHFHPELMLAAVKALARLYDVIDPKEMQKLLTSDRAGLRELGCRLMAFQFSHLGYEALYPLLHDSHPLVRQAAIESLALLNKPIPHDYVRNSSNELLSLCLAWADALQSDNATQHFSMFKPYLNSETSRIRRTAAAMIANCRLANESWVEDVMKNSSDSFVVLNLAVGSIMHRTNLKEAAKVLHDSLINVKEPIALKETFYMTEIVPFKQAGTLFSPAERKAMDLTTRLQLIRMLGIVKWPYTQDLLKSFFQEKTWGVAGTAVGLSLQEGDDEVESSLVSLLEDKDPSIQLQAACVLATSGKKERASAVLLALYPQVDREKKMWILEALSKLEDKTSIPFLVKELNASHPSLRILAASALLRTLYA